MMKPLKKNVHKFESPIASSRFGYVVPLPLASLIAGKKLLTLLCQKLLILL